MGRDYHDAYGISNVGRDYHDANRNAGTEYKAAMAAPSMANGLDEARSRRILSEIATAERNKNVLKLYELYLLTKDKDPEEAQMITEIAESLVKESNPKSRQKRR